MRVLSLQDIATILKIKSDARAEITGYAIDSRKVVPGDLFFALSGNRVDGHDFIAEAAERGAAGVVVKEGTSRNFGIPLLPAPDVLGALQELARQILFTRPCKVVAITGSLGKTTTKEFTATLLRERYKTSASPHNYNSQATLPLSILHADGDEEVLVLEMGMTHVGEIKKLIGIAPPDIAVVTSVAIQHACNFSDGLAGICREKASIFSHPKTALGLYAADAPHREEILESGACRKVSFSLNSREADYFLEQRAGGVRIFHQGEEVDIPLTLPLRPLEHNFLAAVAVARALNVPWDSILAAVPKLRLPAMRFEKVEKQGITFINDAYNANPDSMKAALENLPKPAPGKKTIAVLGEMPELGMYSEGGHAMVAETALLHSDLLFCLGGRCDTMERIWKSKKRVVKLFQTRLELEQHLKEIVQPGDVVLLKGARSQALDHILKGF